MNEIEGDIKDSNYIDYKAPYNHSIDPLYKKQTQFECPCNVLVCALRFLASHNLIVLSSEQVANRLSSKNLKKKNFIIFLVIAWASNGYLLQSTKQLNSSGHQNFTQNKNSGHFLSENLI